MSSDSGGATTVIHTFRNGFPGAAVLDRLCEMPLTSEAAPVGWQRAVIHEDGGSSLRPGETAGMFAPDTEGSAPVVFGPRPGVTAKATAADRMSTSRTAADQRSTSLTAADRVSTPQDDDYTPYTTPPGVTNLTDFYRLVAQTRLPFPDQATDPSCYGGGVSGTGDISSDGNLTAPRLVVADGNKSIATPASLTLAQVTVNTPDDTARLLSDPAKRLEIKGSGAGLVIDNNGSGVTVDDDLDVLGQVTRPTGVGLTPVASNPGTGLLASTLWFDNGFITGDTNRPKVGGNKLAYFSEIPSPGIGGTTGTAGDVIPMADGTGGATLKQGRAMFGAPTTGGGSSANGETIQPLADATKGVSLSLLARDAVSGTNDGGSVNIDGGSASGLALQGNISIGAAKAGFVNLGRAAGLTIVKGKAQFDDVLEIGHSADTTLSRKSAGVLQVETSELYKQGGTDVAVADGGTGASTAQAAINALTAVSGASAGQVLTKVGSDAAWGTLPAEQQQSVFNSAGISVASTSDVQIASKAFTGIAAGDCIEIEMWVMIHNNSGANRTYTWTLDIGGTTLSWTPGQAIGAHATNRGAIKLSGRMMVASSSLVLMQGSTEHGGAGAAGTALPVTEAGDNNAWATSANNETGSQTVQVFVRSSAGNTTQTLYVTQASIRLRKAAA